MDLPEKKSSDDKLLKVDEIVKRLTISRSLWYEGVKSNEFPQPVRIGTRTVRWWESDIDNYLRKNYGGPGKSAG